MPRMTRPLIRFDPGWLFIIAGLVMLGAALLIPAQFELQAMRDQRERLLYDEWVLVQRLERYDLLIDELDRGDEQVLRRLAATQLNKLPEGEKPVLLAGSFDLSIAGWVNASLHYDPPLPSHRIDSMLANFVTGEHRLSVIAGAIVVVFAGVLIGGHGSRVRKSIE